MRTTATDHTATDHTAAARETRVGLAYGLAAYSAWALVVVFFKSVAHVPALEVLAHRVVWSTALLLPLLTLRRQWPAVFAALRSPRTVATLIASTVLIASNWFVFIWAVANGYVLQSSLGYYINPLVNVLLGVVFLRERLTRTQLASVVLAGSGVLYLTLSYRQVPWVALALALSFGLYGLLRKTVPAGPLVGLGVETAFLTPLALVFLVGLGPRGAFGNVSAATDALLVFAGVVTAVPLLWFANAARRLRLATVGLLQYVAPTGQFLLAVAVYGEAFRQEHVVAFGAIWTALVLYSVDAFRAQRAAAAEIEALRTAPEAALPPPLRSPS